MKLIRSTNYGTVTVPSFIDAEANGTGSPNFANLAHSAGKLAVLVTQRTSNTPPSLDAADITDGWTTWGSDFSVSTSLAVFTLRCTSSAHPTPVILNETDLRMAWCLDGDPDVLKFSSGTGPAISWGGTFTTAPNVIVGGYMRYGQAVTNAATALPAGYTQRGIKNSASAAGLGFDSNTTLLSSPTLPAVSNFDAGTAIWRTVLFSIKGVGM